VKPPPLKSPTPKLPPASTFKVPSTFAKPTETPKKEPRKPVEQTVMVPKDILIVSYQSVGNAPEGREAIAVVLLPNPKRPDGFEGWQVHFYASTPEEAEEKAKKYWNDKLDAIARKGWHEGTFLPGPERIDE
jgi:hypothetical protein